VDLKSINDYNIPNMTKQEARKFLMGEAYAFKKMGLSSKEFIDYISGISCNAYCFEAFELIENEIEHIIALTWSRHR
jgi:Fe2+ transport system protein B